jgi:outer membrane protein assembly factor BamB
LTFNSSSNAKRSWSGKPRSAAAGLFLGSSFENKVPGTFPFGLYGVTDTRTGKVAWKIEIEQPAKSGVLVAGDLVFFGEGNGKFRAADAATSDILFTFNGPQKIDEAGGAMASPVAYVVNGREFIVNAFGGNVPDRKNFPPNPVGDTVIAFALLE